MSSLGEGGEISAGEQECLSQLLLQIVCGPFCAGVLVISLLAPWGPAAQDHWLVEKPGWWEFVCPGAGNPSLGHP